MRYLFMILLYDKVDYIQNEYHVLFLFKTQIRTMSEIIL